MTIVNPSVTNTLQNINPSSLPVIGGLPSLSLGLFDQNFTDIMNLFNVGDLPVSPKVGALALKGGYLAMWDGSAWQAFGRVYVGATLPAFTDYAFAIVSGVLYFSDNTAWYSMSPGEGHITILPWAYSATPQGTWTISIVGGALLGGYLTNTTAAAQNDEVDYMAFLSAGTYTLVLLCSTSSNAGIVTVNLDGVSQGTIDPYIGSGSNNVIKTLTGIVVTVPKLYTLGLKMATKNGSSSNYCIFINSLSLYRTA